MNDQLELIGRLDAGFRDHSVPGHLHNGIRGYVLQRRRPYSDFLLAVFQNDFLQVALTATSQEDDALARIGIFVENYTPAACHGSVERVDQWLEHQKAAPPEAPMIDEVAGAAHGPTSTGAAPRTGGNLPPGVDDVQGPDHPGGTEEET